MIPVKAISFSTATTWIPTTITAKNPKTQLNPKTIKSLSSSGKLDEAIHLIKSTPNIDPATYSLLLHACISQKAFNHGKTLYSHFNRNHSNVLQQNPILTSKFITLFSNCGRVNEARLVFEDAIRGGHSSESEIWLAMAIGYSKNGLFNKALIVYIEMLRNCVKPGNFTFSMALKACGELNYLSFGRGVHAQMIKSSEEPDQVVNNALLKLYMLCGCFDEVLMVFDKMPERNIVSWNSLIGNFVKQDLVFEAFGVFRRMQSEGIGNSWVTFTTILPMCARVTALCSGKEIHTRIVKSMGRPDTPVLNALMDMYVKCGVLDYGTRIFDRMRSKDLTSWNTMLTGYAVNGCMREAHKLFTEMISSGMMPDEVTFIVLLSGYSHAGMGEDGQELFNKMDSVYGVSPGLEHYACLVDMLGRAGRIKEALEVVRDMPVKASGSIWGSLLNSCRLHGEAALAEEIAKKLFQLEPDNPGNYVILSNIYANTGMWDSVNEIRETMQTKGIKKHAGCSWIQIKNKLHTFVAGGSFELRNSDEYKKTWNELTKAMEENGYTPDTSVVLHDVNEELKTMWVCGHSERVAAVFALIHAANGIPIRITKNLRVCDDCHSWMKIVSQVTGRRIVLRDTNRFHHFAEGVCSCRDYW